MVHVVGRCDILCTHLGWLTAAGGGKYKGGGGWWAQLVLDVRVVVLDFFPAASSEAHKIRL